MTKLSKSQILGALRCLSPQERLEIFEESFPASWNGASRQTLDKKRFAQGLFCMHCNSRNAVRFGKTKRGDAAVSLQRLRQDVHGHDGNTFQSLQTTCLVATVLGMHEPAPVPAKDRKALRRLTEDVLHDAAPDSRRALKRQCRKPIGWDCRGRRDFP